MGNKRVPWNKGKKGIYSKETLKKLKVKVSKEKIGLNKAEQAIKKDAFKY